MNEHLTLDGVPRVYSTQARIYGTLGHNDAGSYPYHYYLANKSYLAYFDVGLLGEYDPAVVEAPTKADAYLGLPFSITPPRQGSSELPKLEPLFTGGPLTDRDAASSLNKSFVPIA